MGVHEIVVGLGADHFGKGVELEFATFFDYSIELNAVQRSLRPSYLVHH